MALHVNVQGYDEFKKAAEEHADKTIFALFTGSAGSDGRSWCPDCVTGTFIIFNLNLFFIFFKDV